MTDRKPSPIASSPLVTRRRRRGAGTLTLTMVLAAGWLMGGALWAPMVQAQPAATDTKADTLFKTAKQLLVAGHIGEACPMFAESKQLAPGIGISLHLADCYERAGKTGSALSEFREAERLAHAQGDEKRAEVARSHARTLESKAGQLTVASPQGPHDGWQFAVDGTALTAAQLDVPLTVDPGDHAVTVTAPGQPARTLSVHVEAPSLIATIHTDPPPLAAVAPPAPAAAVVAPPVVTPSPQPPAAPSPSSETPPATPEEAPSVGAGGARFWAEVALVGVGLAGAGLGTAFLVNRNKVMNNGTACDPPTVDNGDTTAAIVSYSAGGAALTAAIVLYLTAPHPASSTGLVLAPAMLYGGGGAVVDGRF